MVAPFTLHAFLAKYPNLIVHSNHNDSNLVKPHDLYTEAIQATICEA
jgi:hypothetical protein